MIVDVQAEIRSSVDGMCARAAERGDVGTGTFDLGLWQELADAGFTLLTVPERLGGSGGDLEDLAVVVETAARHRAPVPVAETALLAGWLLDEAGLPVPGSAPITASPDVLVADRDGTTVSGEVTAPLARHTEHLVTLVDRSGELLLSLQPLGDSTSPSLRRNTNLAGEPRDVLVFDRCPLPDSTVPAPASLNPPAIVARGALARTVQLAGAADAVLTMSLRHAEQRTQFGRPLNRFQAVQHKLATLAGEVTAMRTAAMAAVLAVQAQASDSALAIAAAKATASASAHTVATTGHQIHGAMGYSTEHRLGSATTRLWSWRDEFGTESMWQDKVADLVLEPEAWWQALSR